MKRLQESKKRANRRIGEKSAGRALVPERGLEPLSPKAEDFKSSAYTVSPLRRRGNSTVGWASLRGSRPGIDLRADLCYTPVSRSPRGSPPWGFCFGRDKWKSP